MVVEPAPTKTAVVKDKIKAKNPLTVLGRTRDFFSLQPFDMSMKSKQEQEEEAKGSYTRLWKLLIPEKVSPAPTLGEASRAELVSFGASFVSLPPVELTDWELVGEGIQRS